MTLFNQHHWSLILAAGEGTRLRELTRDNRGQSIPKQFCSLHGGASLLRHTLERGLRYATLDHTVAVVAEQHRWLFRRDLQELPSGNVIAQPSNRGTAIGLLLPLLHILHADPDAEVLVLPSDHFIANEQRLLDAIRDAAGQTQDHIALLGIEPEWADRELGWILAGSSLGRRTRALFAFEEKPDELRAAQLFREGALWNSFIMLGKARLFVELIRSRYPHVVTDLHATLTTSRFDTRGNSRLLHVLYDQLPCIDFSRDLLQHTPSSLAVVKATCCGWTDLGTPSRVRDCLSSHPDPQPLFLPYQEAHVCLAENTSASGLKPTSTAWESTVDSSGRPQIRTPTRLTLASAAA